MKIIGCSLLTGIIILFLVSTMAWADTGKVTSRKTPSLKPGLVADDDSAAAQLKKAKIIVETVAYMPAPLKEGSNISMSITFKNIGLVKSYKNKKYNIFCKVLSGGGPDQECAVPSNEMSIGKEIPPGATHSVSLLGATPAKAGKYRVTISIPGNRGRPFSLILNVAPKFIIQKAPKNKVE